MSLEEMAKKYSKKWNVPLDEAKTKVKEFLEKKPEKPVDRTKVTPTAGELFPEPLGPLSKKIMDVNQAALSTAFTRKSLLELGQPPEELKGLREKMDSLEKRVGNVFEFVNTTVKEWKGELDAKRRDEERQQLFNDLNTKVIQPLREKIETIEKAQGGNGEALTRLTPDVVMKTSREVTENAKSWLEEFGYKVEMPKAMSKEQVEAMLKEHEKKVKETFDLEKESRVEEARINAAKELTNTAIDRVLGMFAEPLKEILHGTIERRAAESTSPATPGAGGTPQTPGAPPPIPKTGGAEEWGPPLTPRFAFDSLKPPKKEEKKKAA